MTPVDRLIKLALDEDLGDAGDITSAAIIPKDLAGRGTFVVKERAVIAGTEPAERVMAHVDASVVVEWSHKDGAKVEAGTVVGVARGPFRSLLTAERTALNFLQHLSGVATKTREAADRLQGTTCKLLDTRKTTPGLRALEKAAVRAGGGTNHRMGLFDAILVKDNHIQVAGSVREAIARAKAQSRGMTVEVEVTSLQDVDAALAASADIVMLDNFDPAQIKEAVRRCARKAKVEVSGGVTLDRLREIGASGADFVSMGGLTHSAPAIDISFEIQRA
jgi:nicotinate-nucleotide pyrophosphorylase (carboxylating)